MRARDPVLHAPDVQEALIKVALIPAQVNEFGDEQPMAIGQEDHRGIAVPMASEAPSRLAQCLDLGWGEMLTGTDVTMCVTFGKGEFRHPDLLSEELSCFRCLDPANTKSAA
jgi:hypothetical protein